ncbi:MAG: PIN domain-containing protein [Planctomycetota bacterium]|jgi:rRNA-processing protein FCF1
MPIVVLDTNAILPDFMFDGAHLVKLLVGCRRLGIQVVIPDVVIDELKGNHKQGVAKCLSEIHIQKNRLGKHGIEYDLPNVDIDSECAAYAAHLEKVVDEYDVKIEQYPKVELQELVTASYENKKPFKDTGEGHKDYLIFRTILDLIDKHKENVIFVTNNHKDFCAKDKQLHSDLKALLPDGYSVDVCPSAYKLYKDVLAEELEKLEALDDPEAVVAAINAGTFDGFNLETDLEQILAKELCEEAPDLEEISPPLNDTSATHVDAIEVVSIEVSTLDDSLLNIDVYGSLQIELFGFMDKHEYFGAQDFDLESVYLDDGDWNDWVVSAYTTKTPWFMLNIVFDKKESAIESASVELSLEDQDF